MRVWLYFLFLFLLVIQCLGQTKEEAKELVIDGVIVLLGEIPNFGIAVRMFAPALKTLLGIKQKEKQEKDYTKNFKEIQRGLSEMRTEVIDAIGRVEIAVELDHVRTTELEARMLIMLLEDIFKADNPSFINRTIHVFLEKCKTVDPYQKLLNIHILTEKAYRLQLQNDLYHSTKRLNSVKHSLNGILHELTIVAVAQLEFSGNESHVMQGDFKKLWQGRLDEISNITHDVFEELLHVPYWHKMDNFVTKVMKENDRSDLQGKADLIAEYVFKLHTSDRFCVMTSREELGGYNSEFERTKYKEYAIKDNQYSFENNGYFFKIIRSRTVHNTTKNELEAFRSSVMEMQDFYLTYCPFKDHEAYYKDVMQLNYSGIVVFEESANQILKCDPSVTTLPPLECEVWAADRWQYPTYVVHAMPY